MQFGNDPNNSYGQRPISGTQAGPAPRPGSAPWPMPSYPPEPQYNDFPGEEGWAGDGYQQMPPTSEPPQSAVPPPQYGKAPAPPVPRGGDTGARSKGKGLRTLLWILGVLLGVALLLQGTLFRLNRTQVVGCSLRTPEQVVSLAGLVKGQNIFTLDRNAIEAGINKDRYLIFKDLRVDYPDGLTLYVAERLPCATFQRLGVQYTVDAEGMILEETEKLTMSVQSGIVVVTGLAPTATTLGSRMMLQEAQQLSAYQAVLTELSLQDYLLEISELNVSDLDNLYLVSIDGYAVRLGDQTQMQAKIGSLRAVRTALAEMGTTSGSIDVSSPIYPTYIP